MKPLRLMHAPLAALAVMAMLGGCSDSGSPTAPGSGLDTTPPPAPASLTQSFDSSDRQILTWEASAAPDVVGYEVYVYSPSPDRDNAYVLADDPVTSTVFFLPIVSVATEAIYRVRAMDRAGNRSAFSAAATVTIAPSGGGGGGPITPPDPGGGG